MFYLPSLETFYEIVAFYNTVMSVQLGDRPVHSLAHLSPSLSEQMVKYRGLYVWLLKLSW